MGKNAKNAEERLFLTWLKEIQRAFSEIVLTMEWEKRAAFAAVREETNAIVPGEKQRVSRLNKIVQRSVPHTFMRLIYTMYIPV